MRISDWSSDVCSSDLAAERRVKLLEVFEIVEDRLHGLVDYFRRDFCRRGEDRADAESGDVFVGARVHAAGDGGLAIVGIPGHQLVDLGSLHREDRKGTSLNSSH